MWALVVSSSLPITELISSRRRSRAAGCRTRRKLTVSVSHGLMGGIMFICLQGP